MSDQTINTNITATANFGALTAQLDAVTASLTKLQETTIGLNKNLSNQVSVMNRSFAETMRSTGQFSTHFVTLQGDVNKFGKSLEKGQLSLSQYYQTWQNHAKKTSTLISDLANQQVRMQQAVLQPLGKNAQGLMQYNVMVASGLDVVKNKTALAQQELKIMNKVMQDGANQLINWGKNTQWAGRQLTVGLTVPLAAFGVAASKAFLQADTELVRLTKVYGGLAATSAAELLKVRQDVSATAKEMASAYGVAYTETIALAADMAATGKQGNDLIKSTVQTTRLAVLGEVSRQDAMKATLAIQNTFKQNTQQLTESIDFLNAVENQTSTSLNDLVTAIPKAGPVIQAMGGSVKDLALMLVAMKEGGIDATQGANALKSALASLINPTAKAVGMFKGFGIDLKGLVTANAGNLTGTIVELQKALEKLDPLKKQQAIEQLFGKFQFARMNALFANLGKQGSQTLQVLDLMKASTTDLANVSARELAQVTESASGKYRRALASVQADMAQVGNSFLKINTFVLKTIDGIVKFFNKLPGPVKSVLTLLGGFTAIAGPLIMLTGVLGNFFGYIVKGVFHLKSLFKGGEGFKLLTPELMAAAKAGTLVENSFYSDAKATTTFAEAVYSLSAAFEKLQQKALESTQVVSNSITTMSGTPVISSNSDITAARMAAKDHPLIGSPYSRDMVHLNPTASKTAEENAAQTIFSTNPGPKPVNQRIGNNPQILMMGSNPLPSVPGLTSIRGVSTGIVAEEAAKWHAMTAAIATQSEAEIATLKTEIAATGTITNELAGAYEAMLPEMMKLTTLAAKESAAIVGELEAGKVTVTQARAQIMALNAQVETMMAETATQVATGMARTINLTTVPLTSQPVVGANGKSNMKELFHKSTTSNLIDKIAGSLGVRTSGGGYSVETTKPIRLNTGGKVYDPNKDGAVVPGDKSINYDNTPAKLEEGGFILNKQASQNNPQLVGLAKNQYNGGGKVDALLTPGETYFDPKTASQMMPTLEKANGGSRITFKNLGGRLGGIVSRSIARYGANGPTIKIDPNSLEKSHITDDLSGLMIYLPKDINFNLGSNKSGVSGSKIAETLQSMKLQGLNPNSLILGSASKLGADQEQASRRATQALDELIYKLGTQYPDHIFGGKTDPGSFERFAKSIYSPWIRGIGVDSAKTGGTHNLLSALNQIYTNRAEAKISQARAAELGLIKLKKEESASSSLGQVFARKSGRLTWAPAGKTIGMTVPDWAKGKGFAALATTYTGGGSKWRNALLNLFKPRYALGGKVKNSKHNYGIMNSEAFMAKNSHLYTNIAKPKENPLSWMKHGVHPAVEEMHQRIFAKYPNGQMPVDYATQRRAAGMFPMPHSYYQDITNNDPLHGVLQIGRYQGPMGIRNQQIGARIRYSGSGFMNAGVEPAFAIGDIESRAKTALFNYMQGDYAAIDDPAVQSYLSAIRTKFTGTLHRGVRNINSLPPVIADLVRAGRWEDLVGKEFIMRRSSWSTNKDTAEGFGQLQMVANIKNRNAVPASQIFPDLTFQTASGPVHVNESEVYMGGKFRVVAAGKNQLKLQAVVDGQREHGGPVNAGGSYLVGEKGPELFVPKHSGGIISNYALGGIVRSSKHNYGLSGNPAKRAEQLAAIQARKDAYEQPQQQARTYKPGPLYGTQTTIPGSAGTKVYGLGGSFPKFTGNMWSPMLNSIDKFPGLIKAHSILAAQQIAIGSKMLAEPILRAGKAIDTASGKAAIAVAQATTIVQESFVKMGRALQTAPSRFRQAAIRAAAPIGPIPQGQGIWASARANATKSRFSGFASGDANRSMMTGMGLTMGAGMVGGQAGAALMGTGIVMQMGGLQMISKMTTSMKAFGTSSGGILKGVANNLKAVVAGFRATAAAEGLAGVAGKAFGATLKAIMIDSPLVILLAIVAAIMAIKKAFDWIKKERAQNQKETTLSVGITQKAAEQAGIKYNNLSTSIKDTNAQLELMRAKGKAAFESFRGGGQVQGLTLSVTQLKNAIADAKKNQTELVGAFSNAGDGRASQQDKQKIVNEMAANLKAQFVSSGMSAEDATNKIFAMIKASKNADMAFGAISAKGFTKVTDAASATTAVIENLNKKMGERRMYDAAGYRTNDKKLAVTSEATFKGSDLGNALSNSTAAIEKQMQSLVGTKDAMGNVIDEAKAYSMTMDNITKKQGASTKLTDDQVASLKKTHPELEAILNSTDTTASTFAKWQVELSGVQVDLKNISGAEAQMIAQFEAGIQSAIKAQEATGKGILGRSATLIKTLQKNVAAGGQAAADAAQKAQIDVQNEIKLIDKKIKAIQDEAQARRDAINVQKQQQDLADQIASKQLDILAAQATGNTQAEQQAKLDKAKLVREQQAAAVTDAINAKEKAQVDELSKAKETAQARADAAAKKASDAQAAAAQAATRLSTVQGFQGQYEALVQQKANAKMMAPGKDKDQALKDVEGSLLALVGSISAEAKGKDKGLAQMLKTTFGGSLIDAKTGAGLTATTSTKYNGSQMESKYSAGAAELALNSTADSVTADAIHKLGGGASLKDVQRAIEGKGVLGGKTAATAVAIETETKYKMDSKKKGFLDDASKAAVVKDNKLSPGQFFTYAGMDYKVDSSGNAVRIGKHKDISTVDPTTGLPRNANGGLIKGPGTGTSDSIFMPGAFGRAAGGAFVSNGEFVTKASSVSSIGAEAMNLMNKFGVNGLIGSALGKLKFNTPTNGLQMHDTRSQSNGTIYLTQNIYGTPGMDMDAFAKKVVDMSVKAIGQGAKIETKMYGASRTVRV